MATDTYKELEYEVEYERHQKKLQEKINYKRLSKKTNSLRWLDEFDN